MTTQYSTKFAAFAVALLINGLMLGSVAYLFNGRLHTTASTPIVHIVAGESSVAKF